MSKPTFLGSIIVPSRLVFLMWLVFWIEQFLSHDLGFLGILPRTKFGLIGILTAPLIHGNIVHLISNTFPLLFLGTTVYFFYDVIARKVFLQCYFFTGLLVWGFARSSSFHIGASGLIYGLAAFLIFFGIFRKDLRSLLISVIILSFYWTLIYGILPNQPGISWESHIFGAAVGAAVAYVQSKRSKVAS